MRLPILLLEDDADVQSLLAEALEDDGTFSVHAAATITEAQALVAEHGGSFATAVLDVRLPDGDGSQFCAELRRQGFRWPVILLSGLGSRTMPSAAWTRGRMTTWPNRSASPSCWRAWPPSCGTQRHRPD